jgi:hypothetical protein
MVVTVAGKEMHFQDHLSVKGPEKTNKLERKDKYANRKQTGQESGA